MERRFGSPAMTGFTRSLPVGTAQTILDIRHLTCCRLSDAELLPPKEIFFVREVPLKFMHQWSLMSASNTSC